MDDHYRCLNNKFVDMFENPIFDGKDINLLYGWWWNMSGLGRNVYRKKVYTYHMLPFDYWGTLHVSLWKILMKGMHKIFIQGGRLEQHVEVCRFIVHIYIYITYMRHNHRLKKMSWSPQFSLKKVYS
jgi:hypothetical protein